MKNLCVFLVLDYPFKTSARFHNFEPYPPIVYIFLLLSVGKFGQFLTPPPKKWQRFKWMVPLTLVIHFFYMKNQTLTFPSYWGFVPSQRYRHQNTFVKMMLVSTVVHQTPQPWFGYLERLAIQWVSIWQFSHFMNENCIFNDWSSCIKHYKTPL